MRLPAYALTPFQPPCPLRLILSFVVVTLYVSVAKAQFGNGGDSGGTTITAAPVPVSTSPPSPAPVPAPVAPPPPDTSSSASGASLKNPQQPEKAGVNYVVVDINADYELLFNNPPLNLTSAVSQVEDAVFNRINDAIVEYNADVIVESITTQERNACGTKSATTTTTEDEPTTYDFTDCHAMHSVITTRANGRLQPPLLREVAALQVRDFLDQYNVEEGVPDLYLPEPHTMPPLLRLAQPLDYPDPLVDFIAANRAARRHIEAARDTDQARLESGRIHQRHGSRRKRRPWR